MIVHYFYPLLWSNFNHKYRFGIFASWAAPMKLFAVEKKYKIAKDFYSNFAFCKFMLRFLIVFSTLIVHKIRRHPEKDHKNLKCTMSKGVRWLIFKFTRWLELADHVKELSNMLLAVWRWAVALI